MAKGEMGWFDFTFVPPLGLRVRYRKQFVTLMEVRPHRRKDGSDTTLLLWRADDGREGWAGLRGKSVSLKHREQVAA